MAPSLCSFKENLKCLFFYRLNNFFDLDNVCSNKLVCPKCRGSSVYTVCLCALVNSQLIFCLFNNFLIKFLT